MNPVTELTEKVQKLFGASPIFDTPNVSDRSHCPTVSVYLTLPNGMVFKGTSTNQKLARAEAAKKALKVKWYKSAYACALLKTD